MIAAMVQNKIDAVSPGEYVPTADERVVMYGIGWDGFETLLALRGDHAGPRMAYLDGAVELMSPSNNHEWIKSSIGRLVEVYFAELGITYNCFGSWLLKRRADEAGLEPDECYCFGPDWKDRPDLAIEVVWTSGGINKLEIYRRLRVQEVWFWIDGTIRVHVLGDRGYETRETSTCMPQIDLALLCRCMDVRGTSDALLMLRTELAARR